MKHDEDRSRPLRDQYGRMAAEDRSQSTKAPGYSEQELEGVPQGAIERTWGCGNPTALAGLREGQTVLDLGSGAGLDAFVAARKVGSSGKIIGVDMTEEMVAMATQFAREGGYQNVEFRLGRIENLPVADESVDVIVSNCVVNHSLDKVAAFREAWRVLRPGGRLFVSDLVVEGHVPPPETPGLEVWAEWLKVACGRQPYLDALGEAGFEEVAILAEGAYDGPALTESLAGKIVAIELKASKRS